MTHSSPSPDPTPPYAPPDNRRLDRAALVAELRRQVADRHPEDDTKPWSVAFLNLAKSLEAGELP